VVVGVVWVVGGPGDGRWSEWSVVGVVDGRMVGVVVGVVKVVGRSVVGRSVVGQ